MKPNLHSPLPPGTEVVTRVDRVTSVGTIRKGSIGRVASIGEHRISVQMISGNYWYDRAEIVPRRAGQIKFEVQKKDTWDTLKSYQVLRSRVGSRAWGLANENSDEDLRGVFAPPYTWTTGLQGPPEDIGNPEGTENCWSVHKTIQQALRADPNTLEMLFVPNIEILDPIGQWLVEAREFFVSQKVYGSFGQYALSQLKKMRKGLALIENRNRVLGWLAQDPLLSLEQVASALASHVEENIRPMEAVKSLYRSLFDLGALKECSFDGLKEFACSPEKSSVELPRDLRPKNAYNLLRLLHSAIRWLRTGSPLIEVEPGPLRDRLLQIKHSQVALEDVIEEAEQLAPELEDARHHSVLPEHPNLQAADELMHRVNREMAKRWFEDKFTPPPPPLQWENDNEDST